MRRIPPSLIVLTLAILGLWGCESNPQSPVSQSGEQIQTADSAALPPLEVQVYRGQVLEVKSLQPGEDLFLDDDESIGVKYRADGMTQVFGAELQTDSEDIIFRLPADSDPAATPPTTLVQSSCKALTFPKDGQIFIFNSQRDEELLRENVTGGKAFPLPSVEGDITFQFSDGSWWTRTFPGDIPKRYYLARTDGSGGLKTLVPGNEGLCQ